MFDLAAIRAAIDRHGPVARVVIAAHDGSSPREVGAAMLVWADGQSGTIGGGALEHEATIRAREMLPSGGRRLDREALGPKLGQCCGGRVTLLTEVFAVKDLEALAEHEVFARAPGGGDMPLAVRRLLADARAQGQRPRPQLVQGWLVEPMAETRRDIWIWGAGHVGRAMVAVLGPLPGLHLTWIDTARDRFPTDLPEGVTPIWAAHPELLADHAPITAEHLIMTFSHALDLELCHRLLHRGFKGLGLIGSDTKWARFQSRLARLGHAGTEVRRITCPIGTPALGKHPQAIAIGVAVQLMERQHKSETEITGDTGDRRKQG